MNTMKKTVAVAAIAALGLTGLAGCGGDAADDGKGHVYYMNNKSEVVDQLQQIADLERYAPYLEAKIDYANGEYEKYQNSMQMFNSFWGEFLRWFALVYRPADTHGEVYL